MAMIPALMFFICLIAFYPEIAHEPCRRTISCAACVVLAFAVFVATLFGFVALIASGYQ
jgi:hypothetical protein